MLYLTCPSPSPCHGRSAAPSPSTPPHANNSVSLPLALVSLAIILARWACSSLSTTTSAADENLTARLSTPESLGVPHSRREARHDMIDLADAGSATTVACQRRGLHLPPRRLKTTLPAVGVFLLQSRAFRRHANGADFLLFFLLVFFFSLLSLATLAPISAAAPREAMGWSVGGAVRGTTLAASAAGQWTRTAMSRRRDTGGEPAASRHIDTRLR